MVQVQTEKGEKKEKTSRGSVPGVADQRHRSVAESIRRPQTAQLFTFSTSFGFLALANASLQRLTHLAFAGLQLPT